MARIQWCRNHIDEVAEACNLSRQAKDEVKQAGRFCDENAEFSALPTKPIIALIRIRDEPVKERAISLAKNALNRTTPTGGRRTSGLTERDMKRIIESAKREVLEELGNAPPVHQDLTPQEPEAAEPTPSATSTEPTEPEVSQVSQSSVVTDGIEAETNEINTLSDPEDTGEKIQKLREILKPKHLQYLQKMVSDGNALNELEALNFILDQVSG
jgi:hypothetical protein